MGGWKVWAYWNLSSCMHLNYPGPESCILSDSPTPHLGAHCRDWLCLPATRYQAFFFLDALQFSSVQFSSVTQSCLTLCDPMDCSKPGFSEILIWRAGMASGCDILVYWYGKKYFSKKTSSIPRARRSCGSPKMTLMILRALSVAQQTSEKRATQGAANIMSFCPWNPRTKSLFPTWPSSECLRAKLLQSCPTLCGTVDCSPPGSSVQEILQARILEWVAMPSPRGSSTLVLLVFFPRMTKL